MKGKKALFLFLAFLLPALIFIFLKIFGKNEFAVPPLYQVEKPEVLSGCTFQPTTPYHVPDSVITGLHFDSDSLVCIWYGNLSHEGSKQFKRVMAVCEKYPVKQLRLDKSYQSKCVFFLKEPYDVALIDHKGLIRGQYVASDREEIDRLLIEVDIILKKY